MLPLRTPIQAPGPALRGPVVRPGDAAYEGLRHVHNAMVDRHPALIAQVADAGDVAAALAHARAHGLPVSVRGGGHATTGHAVAEDGVVIDVRRLRHIGVRVASRTVRVGGGAIWAELDAATQEHGLAVTGARVSSVGVAGFTLGSGSGWLERKMGLAADNLPSARVVVADGREVKTSRTQHPDLFWGLQGAGANLGVVTELELRTIPLGPTVLAGMRAYPFDRAREVMSAYRDVMATAPDELCGGIALITAPSAPFVPEVLQGQPMVAVIVLWAGDQTHAEEGIAPLGALGEPCLDVVQPMPYASLQTLLEPPPGAPTPRLRHYFRFGQLTERTDAAIATFAGLGGELSTAQSSIVLNPLGGAFARMPEADTALGGRDATWTFRLLSAWSDARDDAPNIAWTRAAAAELAEDARCAPYPNFVCDEDRRRLAVPYAPETLARLREVKRTWDPDNVFRSNHNIDPAA